MEKKYVLAVDQSTQGTKAILFDRAGRLVAKETLPHRQIVNEQGWVSHDLDEIYRNTVQVVKNVVKAANVTPLEIAALGISNQRETSAAWRRDTGEPLDHAIVWQCSRAKDICERVKSNVVLSPEEEARNAGGVAEIIRQRTGMHLSPFFPAAKFAWLLENSRGVGEAKKVGNLCLGTIDSYLLYRLTNGAAFATDYSNASRTQLFNIHTLSWDAEICSWFGIDPASLPQVCDSSHQYGETTLEGFFAEPLPIASLIGDSQAALFGQGGVEPGTVKATYGTGSSVMMNAGEKKPGEKAPLSDNGLVTSLGWGLDGRVTNVFEGNINYSAAVVTWLKDDLKLIADPGETGALAEAANANDGTYLVPAFSGLGAPYWNNNARAALYGMSRTTGKNEVVKAALESIAYQITDIVTLMADATRKGVVELCVDGGATKNRYLMQFQSDILGTTITLPRCEESSSLGAAFMAGLATGFYTMDTVTEKSERTRYTPLLEDAERKRKYAGWQKAVRAVLG